MTTHADTTARLLITCPDRPGIVAAVSAFLFEHGANITELDQHSTDPEGGKFFMRLEFQTPRLDLGKDALHRAFGEAVGKRFGMLVESIGVTPAQIVVERAMYSDANGVNWAAGTNALATKLP